MDRTPSTFRGKFGTGVASKNRPMTPEQELLARIQGGDTDAFAALVEQYRERALRLAYGFVQNWEDAKDVSQVAFIKAYRSIGRFQGQSGFYTWYYRILANTAKDFLRRRWWHRLRREVVLPERADENALDAVPGKSKTAGEIAMHGELFHCIEDFMRDLPWAQKQVVLLRYNDHQSLEEIARQLNKAVGTVKAQLFSAHQSLRRRLKQHEEGPHHD